MTEQIDFLRLGVNQIRHQIRNILESYNHDWDVIAEMAQNSVDAISLRKPDKGRLNLEIDATNKRIILEDNGCGIHPDKLPRLLTPFSTDKFENSALIGQKGVGITFVIFSSSTFEIESHHQNGSSRAAIEGASAWLDTSSNQIPKLSFERLEPTGKLGTRVSVSLPQSIDFEIFKLSFDQLAMVLQTRTAIGDTRVIWGHEVDKCLSLSFKDLNGALVTKELDCSYFLPTSRLRSQQFISLAEFRQWNTGDKTDAQKRKKLRDKLVLDYGETEKAGRTIRYWACFVPKRKDWDNVSISSGLVDANILELDPIERIESYGDAEYLFSGGMYTSTKGMPTGIRSEMRARGSAGYLPNFFIIVDDPLLSFDIGRKSIAGRQLGMLRDIAADVFRNLINSTKKYVGGEPETLGDTWSVSKIFREIRALPNLNSDYTKFQKRPLNQEASVAAIFFELIGNGKINGFRPLVSGYKNKYDLYAIYDSFDVVVEFKYALSSLFRDFDDEKKLFDEINIVVVWEITEKDRAVVSDWGLELDEIEIGLTTENDPNFHYYLTYGTANPIYIMCLSKLV